MSSLKFMASRKLIQRLVSPAKLASTLDWKRIGGTVLSLDIHKDRIGMALSSHPSIEENPEILDSIHFKFHDGKLPEQTKRRLESIADENDVCGIVVAWPLQKDTGHMGAGCGRTLHVLEELAEETNMLQNKRPFCLWDSAHIQPSCEDSWGRCTEYTRTSNKDTHIASLEQYAQDETVAAANVWDDFVQSHWPNVASITR